MFFNAYCPVCESVETECNTHSAWCYECGWSMSSDDEKFAEFRAKLLSYRESVANIFDKLSS